MKKLPIGIQNFRKIIEGDYLYVDKTQFIYELINGASYYFLSRPRRFGKSLLLDTLGEAFCGDKELFKGLWIYDSGYDFAKHPVVRLDMSNIANNTPEVLEESLLSYLKICYLAEGFEIANNIASDAFMRLIILLYEKYGNGVVVLIDEYDKPMLDHIMDIETAEMNRKLIKGFYGILKSMDRYLRLTFITGVSKFSKTSVFSELNNLLDITLTTKYANICGIITDDVERYFGEHMELLSTFESFGQYNNLRDEILAWYDGYSWDGKTRLINPFSLMTFFTQERFGSYWFESGSPKFLIDLIKKKPGDYTDLKHLVLQEYMLDNMDLDKVTVEPLLFQTGYLTVKEIVHPPRRSPEYIVEMPNFEVREAFNMHLVSALTESDSVRTWQAHSNMRIALKEGDLLMVRDVLRGLFASIPYNLHIDQEAYYHSIFYAIMNILGLDMDVEVSVSKGRVDAIIELEDKAYVMEFKYEDCSPDASEERKQELFSKALTEGMKQIEDRGYAERYQGSGKAVYKVAFAFHGRDNVEVMVC